MPPSSVVIQRVSGDQAIAHLAGLRALYLEVYAEPPYEWGEEHAVLFSERFTRQSQEDGFDMVEARDGAGLVGMAFGAPGTARAWTGLLAPVPAELSAEPPGRTFFLIELLVKAPWRRQGVASAMLDLLFTGRPQERAMLTALPSATAAQAAYRLWSWQQVAQKRNPLPGSPVFDILIKDLRPPPGPGQVGKPG
jgi:GNAT superfamily N-acetyltransferase